MDANQFDDLLRSLASRTSRRALTALAVGSPLAALLGASDLEAKKGKKKRKKKNKKKKPTCSDGRKNGRESDVDCGGNCPRCANGKSCSDRKDCAGAFCANGVCAECSFEQCGSDESGECFCEQTIDGPKTCNNNGEPVVAESCDACPAGMRCIVPGPNAKCVKACGAA